MNLGNLFESEEERGISALMQETLLKGTQRQSAIDFNRAVENMGATINSSFLAILLDGWLCKVQLLIWDKC